MNPELERSFLTGLENNQEKLLRVCSAYARNEEDKKDLFQEVLMNIWKSMPTFNEHSSINTWMFRITLNVCMRLRSRQEKSRSRIVKLDTVSIQNLGTESPDANNQLFELRECIKNLNEADKAIITLFLEELPYKEISDITGLSENNVAVKIKRIKEKLLKCLNREL